MGMHAAALYRDDAVLVVRKAHPVRGPRLSAKAFNALGHVDIWLSLGRPGMGNRYAEAFFAQHGLTRRLAMVAPGFAAGAAVAAATDLAAGMPRRVAERLRAMMPLRLLELPTPPMAFEMQLVWHERTHADAGSRCFRQLVLDAVPAAPKRRGA